MTPYTREQLEKMDDTELGLQVGRWCDDFADDPDAWLTGDGMLALMEWCFDQDWNVSISDATELKWQAVLMPNVHGGFTAEADTPPRALAIAFVLAMQEKRG